MNIEVLIKDLDPVTIIEFKNYLSENLGKLCKVKNSNSKIICNHRNGDIICKHCNTKMCKNGKTKNGVQKYICNNCKYTCSATTDTVVAHSHLSFDVWSNVIDNLLDGFSIRRIAEENNISVNTSFRLRHKILLALKKFVKSIKLKKAAQSDEKYFSINLKGTKPKNMPRYSKRRTSTKSPYRGISHHKVCTVSSIDEEDNLILEISGLGRCTTEMLENVLGDRVIEVNSFNTDSATAYRRFCKEHQIELNAIPSGKHSDGNINISKINGIHSQLEIWLSKFKGVSIRHLQEYLDWFVFIYTMKKRFNLSKIKTESYNTIVIDNNYIKANQIVKIELPIDINVAYGEYSHQS